MTRPTALVTDAGLGSSVSAMRSLAAAGYRVVAADARRRSAGMVSRAADAGVVYASPSDDATAFVDGLLDAVERYEVDALLPVTDASILPIDLQRHRFPDRCSLVLPGTDQLEAAADKYRTVLDMERLGGTAPTTHLVRSVSDAKSAAVSLGWPVVVKPRRSARLVGNQVHRSSVDYAFGEDDLERVLESLGDDWEVLLQRWEAGHGIGVELLMSDGVPIRTFQHERIREFPVHGGPGALRRSVAVDHELSAQSAELLRAWEWNGLAMVEFRTGHDRPTVMEVNGRVWGSLPLAEGAGVDFTVAAVRLASGDDPGPQLPYRTGRVARNLTNDLMWVASVASGEPRRKHPELPAPQRRAGFRAAAQFLDPRIRTDAVDLRDPLSTLVVLVEAFKHLAEKLIGLGSRSERPRDSSDGRRSSRHRPDDRTTRPVRRVGCVRWWR